MGIMQGLRKKGSSRGSAAASAPKPPTPKQAEATAPLMLLLPDAAGIAAYQLNQFPSPKAAEFFLDSSLRGKTPEGAVMFWALNWEPKGIADAEPLVLIRDGAEVVYPFSFSDIDSAFDFVRHEMQRGLHLFQVMIYWAVPARAEADFWGRSTIVPAEAPRRPAFGMSAAPIAPMVEDVIESVIVVPPVELPQIEASEVEDDSERFLQDEDIADAVRQANHIATHTAPEVSEEAANVLPMPVPPAPSRKSKKTPKQAPIEAEGEPIDFAVASQKVGESRAARAAINGWSNFAFAVDEMLDVYVARQVATKLAWNRISRALGQAIEAKRRFDVEEAERKAREAAAAAEEARIAAERAIAEEATRVEEEKLAAARAAAAEAARIAAAKEAARVRGLVFAWQNTGFAMADTVRVVQRDRMIRRSWSVATVQLASAAKTVGKRKVMRKAWLNAAWTLEEAAYAYVLEQKSRAIRTWRIASFAIAEAAQARINYEFAMKTAWSNAGVAIGEAHRVHAAQLRMLKRSWATGSKQIRIAVLTSKRMARVRTGLDNFAMALEEAFEAKAYQEEMILAWDAAIDGLLAAVDAKHYVDMMSEAWDNVAFALEGVCRAYIRKQKRAIRAWGRIGKAFGSALKAKLEQDAAIAAWTNISFALEDAVFAKRRYLGMVSAWQTGSAVLSDSAQRKYRGLVFAWTSATAVVAEAVVARRAYEAAVSAWQNASLALEEATVACARYWAFVDAWDNAGYAMREAVEAYLAWKAGLESAWEALTFAFDDAVHAKMFRDRSIAAWKNAMLGIGQMVQAFVVHRTLVRYWRNAGLGIAEAVPVYLFKMQSIAAWQTAAVAFKQVIVLDAKLRISAAKLDRKQMAAVDKLVKTATTRAATKPARKGAKGKRGAVVAVAEAEKFLQPASLKTHVMLSEELLPDDFEEEFDELPGAVAGEMDGSNEEETNGETPKTPLFPGLWRTRDASRWAPKEGPFNGFKSPPGRFHHTEHEKPLP